MSDAEFKPESLDYFQAIQDPTKHGFSGIAALFGVRLVSPSETMTPEELDARLKSENINFNQ
jgi:hypothetical protein